MKAPITVLLLMLSIASVTASDVVPSPDLPASSVSVNTINPYELLNATREQVAGHFPALSERELDLLLFKIADINSIRSLKQNE